MSCRHKTFLDHTNDGERYPDGKLAWRCSNCGLVNPWGDSWSYYGSIECPKCQTAFMEWVACSRNCAIVLNGGTMPKEPSISDDRLPRKARARKTRMTIRDKAAAYDRLVAEGKVPKQ